jgi:hypothetical protein
LLGSSVGLVVAAQDVAARFIAQRSISACDDLDILVLRATALATSSHKRGRFSSLIRKTPPNTDTQMLSAGS